MQKLRNLKHIFVVIVLSLSAVFSSIFLVDYSDLSNNLLIYRTGNDAWQDIIYKHTLKPSNDIAIIRIDDNSLNKYKGKSDLKEIGLPKSVYIDLIDILRTWGVKGIAFDIMFENADSDEGKFLKKMKEKNDVVIATDTPDLCMDKYNDIRRSNPDLFSDFPMTIRPLDCESKMTEMISYASSQGSFKIEYQALVGNSGSNSNMQKLRFYCDKGINGLFNCPGIPREIYKTVPWGMINLYDSNFFLRPVVKDIGGRPYAVFKKTGTGSVTKSELQIETLPLALYHLNNSEIKTEDLLNYTAVRSTLLSSLFGQDIISAGGPNQLVLNPYFGSTKDSYVNFSLADILTNNTNGSGSEKYREAYKGKYVFVGESGTKNHDTIVSPVTGEKMDGVESHAHFLDGLLQDKMLTQISIDLYGLLLIFLTISFTFLYFYLPDFFALLLAIIFIPIAMYLLRYSYDIDRTLIDSMPVIFACSLPNFFITYTYKFFIVDREKRQLKSNFAHYIDPRVVDQIVDKSDSIELGGEKRNLSVLFSDIAGFTTISETLDPRDLFYLMTSYLSYMTDILIKEGGTLDKYIGDAVMGFFGAPISYEDHAIRSANTAILMRKALAKFNMEIGERGIESIDFRVGIASGEVMVGNIGSHDRFNYTVLGDTVNLASRLEGTGKEYDVHIIISHATKMALTPHFFTRELDTIAVKGKTEGVRIYELVGYGEEFVDRTKYTLYERALGLYRAGDYREAGKLWQTQVSLDPPSRIMMLRCVDILKGTTQVKDGVYHMTHK